jgi:hypothetical protein
LEGAFFYLSFLKYLIIREALLLASEVFFVDADVLVYCNPWSHLSLFNNTSYDYVYSPEYVHRRSYINGGQYFLRNTAKVKEWLQLMIQSRQLICQPHTSNEKQHQPQGSQRTRTRSSLSLSPSSLSSLSGGGGSRPPPSPAGNSNNKKQQLPLLDQDYARMYAEQIGLKLTWAPVRELGSHNHHRSGSSSSSRPHSGSNSSNLHLFPSTACTNHVCGITGR